MIQVMQDGSSQVLLNTPLDHDEIREGYPLPKIWKKNKCVSKLYLSFCLENPPLLPQSGIFLRKFRQLLLHIIYMNHPLHLDNDYSFS